MRAISAAFLIGLVVAPAWAGQDKVDLAWRPKVGQVKKYTMHLTSNFEVAGTAIDLDMTTTNVQEIKAIDGDKVTVAGHVEAFKMLLNGSEMDPSATGGPDPREVKVTMVQSMKTGEVLSTERTGPGEAEPPNPRLEAMGFFHRPDKTIKVGESWTSDIKADEKKKTMAATAKYTVESTETVLGKSCYKITYAYSETGVPQPCGATGTFWIDVAEGSPVKFEAAYENVVFREGLPPTSAKITLALVP